jgi:predicted metalloprotease
MVEKDNRRDSAPGVDDGRARSSGPAVNAKPGGRRGVFLLVAAALVIVAFVLMARPNNQEGDQDMVKMGAPQSEMEASTVAGAAPPTNAAAAPAG